MAAMSALLLMLAGALAAASETPDAEPITAPITAKLQALEVAPVAAGQRGELSLIVLEPPDRALPLEIRLDAGPLVLDDNRLDWSAVVDPLALVPRVRASFRAPSEPGTYAVRASVGYWVCGEQWCRRKFGEITWRVVVE
jgi:hypothetical protein